MVAALLYLIGLIGVLGSIAVIGYSAPTMFNTFNRAMDAPNANVIDAIVPMIVSLNWAITPLIGGLILMGLARVMMLLGSIDRSLRGNS